MFATIDIGTNSVLLLVAEAGAGGSVRAAMDLMTVTRLGEGLVASGTISDAARGRTIACLRRYRDLCAERGVREIAAVGTAALRRAANAADVLRAVQEELGIDIEVLSAEREAALTFRSCTRDFGDEIVVVDIGGGSTEVITAPHPSLSPPATKTSAGREGRGDSVPSPHGGEGQGEGGSSAGMVAVSLPVGSVSLTERFLKSDPPTTGEIASLHQHVRRLLEEELDASLVARPHDRELIATAGTATTLAAMNLKLAEHDSSRIHGSRLSIERLRDLIDAMRTKTVEERKRMPGLLPARADVILAGAELLQDIMSFLGQAVLTVSDRGLRWGLFEEKFCRGMSF